jgi:VWFA-related protein
MRRLVVAFVAMGLGVSGLAQTAAPPPQTPPPPAQAALAADQAPQFRSSIDIVRLDVTVLDKARRPVRGLVAADFTVFENGAPQPISAFTSVDVPEPMPDPAAAPWLRNVPFDVRGNAEIQQRRLLILAIDDATIQNDPKAVKAVKEIGRSVVDKLGPADLMSVVFTRDNRNSQDFTNDRAL